MDDAINKNSEECVFDNAESFSSIRKLLSAQLVTEGIDAETAAIISDRGVFEAKTAYDVGSGTISEQDAVENLIDRGAAQVSIWFQQNGEQLCEQGGLWVGTLVGDYLSAWCPTALPICQKIGQTCGKALGRFGKAVIDDGMKKIAAYAKSAWREVKEKAGEFLKKTLDFFA